MCVCLFVCFFWLICEWVCGGVCVCAGQLRVGSPAGSSGGAGSMPRHTAARGANAAHNACGNIAGKRGGKVLQGMLQLVLRVVLRVVCCKHYWVMYCGGYCGWYCIYHWNFASTSTSSYRWAALSQLRSWFMPRSIRPLQAGRRAGRGREGHAMLAHIGKARHGREGSVTSMHAKLGAGWAAGRPAAHATHLMQRSTPEPAGPPT
jgi:hypothetical protein